MAVARRVAALARRLASAQVRGQRRAGVLRRLRFADSAGEGAGRCHGGLGGTDGAHRGQRPERDVRKRRRTDPRHRRPATRPCGAGEGEHHRLDPRQPPPRGRRQHRHRGHPVPAPALQPAGGVLQRLDPLPRGRGHGGPDAPLAGQEPALRPGPPLRGNLRGADRHVPRRRRLRSGTFVRGTGCSHSSSAASSSPPQRRPSPASSWWMRSAGR